MIAIEAWLFMLHLTAQSCRC